MKSKTKHRWRISLYVFTGLCLLLLGPSAVFSCRHFLWNRQLTRGDDGVAESSRPFSIGAGNTALLLIHGFGDGPGVWEQLAPALAQAGFRVHAMRLPGWGEPLAVKRTLSFGDWEAAITDEVASLRQAHDQVLVIGHSLGGCLSASLAMRGELDADGLILYAPMFAVADDRSPGFPTRSWFRIGETLLPQRMVVESLFPDHTRVAEPRSRSQRDPFVPLSVFALLYEAMDKAHQAPATLSMPVRVLLPGEDHVVHSAATRDWFESLAAPDKTLLHQPDAGHVLPLDIEPALEAAAIRAWWEPVSGRFRNHGNSL